MKVDEENEWGVDGGNNSVIWYKIEKEEVEMEKGRCKRRQGSGRCPFNVNANVRVFPYSNLPSNPYINSTYCSFLQTLKKSIFQLFISTNRYRTHELLSSIVFELFVISRRPFTLLQTYPSSLHV